MSRNSKDNSRGNGNGEVLCALCLEEKPLQKSHLLPKAMYRGLREEGDSISNPILITQGVATSTSRQLVQPLLCSACEQRFGTREKLAVSYSQRELDTESRFLQEVKQEAHMGRADPPLWFEVRSGSPLPVEDLAYFALSVFWRGSVAKWGPGAEGRFHGALGSYEESLRRYLLGEDPLPSTFALWAEALLPGTLGQAMMVPATAKSQVNGGRQHRLLIPGIAFVLLVGSQLIPVAHQGSFYPAKPARASIVDSRDTWVVRQLGRDIRSAQRKGKLRDAWDRHS